ncbi:MAG: hypothetical protein JWM85_2899 [Acidimicrobiaceae bacterium]|nr:hypothetical protein [Acidimicrobiaceae bacterium]
MATPLSGIRGALLRYRVMAWTVGVGLLVLVLVGIPLQFAANSPGVVMVVGPIHGFLYVVYLFFALDVARRARFSPLQLAMMVGAGLLPFLAFFIERRVTALVEAEAARIDEGAVPRLWGPAVMPGRPSPEDDRPDERGSGIGSAPRH